MFIPSYKKPSSAPEPYVPPSWSTGTDEEIVEALEKHYAGEIDLHDYWSVGDTRTVHLSAMSESYICEAQSEQDVVFVLSEVGGKVLIDDSGSYIIGTCVFQVDQLHSLTTEGHIQSTANNSSGWGDATHRRNWCNNTYYNAIPSTLRPIFKKFKNKSGKGNGSTSGVNSSIDYFALRAEIEVTGTSGSHSVENEGTQITWYKTSSNRIKNFDGSGYAWWLRSPYRGNKTSYCYIYSNGSDTSSATANTEYGIAPFGVI